MSAPGCLCNEIDPTDRPCLVCDGDDWVAEELERRRRLAWAVCAGFVVGAVGTVLVVLIGGWA